MAKLISDIFTHNTHVSFEFFPPKTSQGLRLIYQSVAKLKDMNPDFVSVTYGAGGSTAEKSLEIASALTNLGGLTCVAHITCVGFSWCPSGYPATNTPIDEFSRMKCTNSLA